MGNVPTKIQCVGVDTAPDVEMHSDWSTATGQSDAAIRDTDKAVPWTSDVPTVAEVVSASGSFVAGFANCLKVWGELDDSSGLWRIGTGPYANVKYDAGLPEADEYRYTRFYWRYDITDPPNNNETINGGGWGGTHPTEIGADQGSVLHKMTMPSTGSTYQYIIVLFNSSDGTRTFYVTLDKATEYRIEEKLAFQSATTWYYDIKIFSAADVELFEGSDFTLWGHSDPMTNLWYKRSGDYPMDEFKLGQNSSYSLLWDSGPDRNIEMFKYGGWAYRTSDSDDDWIGKYSGGV